MMRRIRRAMVLAAAVGLAIAVGIHAETTPPGDLTITILYDNYEYAEGLQTAWGFSALVEIGDHTILFDTGGDGPTLLSNGAALGVEWSDVEVIVLSHEHGDHVGGLLPLLDTGITPTVYAPASLPATVRQHIRARTELVQVTDAVEFLPGVYSTGEITALPIEQSLVLETTAGLVVITGCAHPGIVNIVERVRTVVEDDICLVVGGFHLANRTQGEVRPIAEELLALGVQHVCPTHCTGDGAIAVFEEMFGDAFMQGGVGRVIVLEDLTSPTE